MDIQIFNQEIKRSVLGLCSSFPCRQNMVGCEAYGCSSRSERGVKMYAFPKDPERRKKWLAKVSRMYLTITDNYNSKKLCEVE